MSSNERMKGTPATTGMQTAAGKHETAVTPAISKNKDDSNSVTAYNSRNASNSRNESNNRTGTIVGMEAKVGLLAKVVN